MATSLYVTLYPEQDNTFPLWQIALTLNRMSSVGSLEFGVIYSQGFVNRNQFIGLQISIGFNSIFTGIIRFRYKSEKIAIGGGVISGPFTYYQNLNDTSKNIFSMSIAHVTLGYVLGYPNY